MKRLNLSNEKKKELSRQEIKRVAEKLGKPPTKIEFKGQEDTKISYGQIVYLYGTWNAAVHDAGLPINLYRLPPSNEISKEELIQEFIRAANAEGKMPSFRLFRKHSDLSLTPFIRHFKSWNSVKQYVYDNYRDELRFAPPKILPKRKRRKRQVQ